MPGYKVCLLSELPPGSGRRVVAGGWKIGVFNCGTTIYAIEDRCSHDDGPLTEGPFHPERCLVECPRHGSLFDLKTGRPVTLPAYAPVEVFPVQVEGGEISVDLG